MVVFVCEQIVHRCLYNMLYCGAEMQQDPNYEQNLSKVVNQWSYFGAQVDDYLGICHNCAAIYIRHWKRGGLVAGGRDLIASNITP